jgi:septum formation protein
VEAISVKKCHAVRDALAAEGRLDADTVILASDTLVMLDGEFLGKPRDEADARRMVGMLQGRTHTVASGIAIWHKGRTVSAHELTGVTFAPMTEGEIEAYIATGEPFGKAGGYAIQGHAARYITGIRGDYFNVVGLPVRRLYETLALVFGIHL